MLISNINIKYKDGFKKNDKINVKDNCIVIKNNGDLFECIYPDIVCTEIHIMNGLGIIFYLYEKAIKVIKKNILDIEISNNNIIVYNAALGNNNISFSNIILSINTNQLDIVGNPNETTKKTINIGDKVYVSSINCSQNQKEETLLVNLMFYLKDLIKMDEPIIFEECKAKNLLFEALQLEVIEKINEDIYKLKPTYKNEILCNDYYYSMKSDIVTFDNLIETCEILFKKNK